MPWILGADGCRRFVTDRVIREWARWRGRRPGWHAPVTKPLLVCGKVAALVAPVVGGSAMNLPVPPIPMGYGYGPEAYALPQPVSAWPGVFGAAPGVYGGPGYLANAPGGIYGPVESSPELVGASDIAFATPASYAPAGPIYVAAAVPTALLPALPNGPNIVGYTAPIPGSGNTGPGNTPDQGNSGPGQEVVATPEPASWAILLVAVVALAIRRRPSRI